MNRLGYPVVWWRIWYILSMEVEKSREYAYPHHLAVFVHERWGEPGSDSSSPWSAEPAWFTGDPAPDEALLEWMLSVCYQASLLREEERQVTFRAILVEPRLFALDGGPPSGLHRMEFAERRAFDEHELRRLSPAADFYRSLIGVCPNESGELEIWGLVHSGPRWIQSAQGGRDYAPPLPVVPVVHVTGPGRIEVRRGDSPVGKLEGGRLTGTSVDVFDSQWLSSSFAPVRQELEVLHKEARERAGEPWAPLDPNLTRLIGQHTVRRIISVMRGSHHGGTVLFIPEELTEEFSEDNRYVSFNHRFPEGAARRRFRALIVEVMNRLAETHGRDGAPSYSRAVGWEEYRITTDEVTGALDEAIFELAHLIAALSAVDGAVAMTKRFELLGFGAEISGELPAVRTVRRALDLEGDQARQELTDGVGTRHRSAYRLAGALPGAIAVVVSQDGGARFVTHKAGAVTYWDQT